MANDALKRLESGGVQIPRQHDDIQKAFEMVNKKIEDTRQELNHDSANINQDFRAYAAQVQQDAEDIKSETKRFASEVQRALAQSASHGTAAPKSSGGFVSLKETSVDRLPEDVSRADFSSWVEGVDGWT